MEASEKKASNMIRVVVVDDHPVVRRGLMAACSDEPDFEVVGDFPTAEEALDQIDNLKPEVLILDFRLVGMNGAEACGEVLKHYPWVRPLILTSFSDDKTIMAAYEAGALGFVVKDSDCTALRQAIRSVAEGQTYIDPKIAKKVTAIATRGFRGSGPYGLTPMEETVATMLLRGLTNREIGRELGISEQTVKTHMRNLMHKMGVHDRTQAAALVEQLGLLPG